MPGHPGLSLPDPLVLAALVTLALAAGCGERPPAAPPPQRDGVDGLVELLAARHDRHPGRDDERFAGCVPDPATRDALVTLPYRGHATGDVRALAAAWRRDGVAHARALYADDPEVPASLRRARPAVPVGPPPLVARVGDAWLPALFVFHRGRWWCLIGLDAYVADRLPATCRRAYLGATAGRCLDLSAPLAAAALADDRAARERLCALIVDHGCDSVPAAAPAPTP